MSIGCEARFQTPRLRRLAAVGASGVVVVLALSISVRAQDSRPYDDKLTRLAEIMGAVHYLRELCSANEGQLWRERMRELLDAESSTALRRARLTRSFNQGYRSYSRTYATCTPSAQTVIARFLAEGVQLADALVKNSPVP